MIAKRITQNKYIKFIIVVLVVLAMGIGSIQTVYGANGWDENSHNRWVSCGICGGSGSRTENCPTTISGSCPKKTMVQCGGLWEPRCSGANSSTCSVSGHSPLHYPECDREYCTLRFCPCPHQVSVSCSRCSGTGIYTEKCPSCDGSGSRVVACSTGSFQYDNSAPTLSLAKTTDANDQGYTGQEVTVTANAGDNLSGIKEYYFDVFSKKDSNGRKIRENRRNELESPTLDLEVMAAKPVARTAAQSVWKKYSVALRYHKVKCTVCGGDGQRSEPYWKCHSCGHYEDKSFNFCIYCHEQFNIRQETTCQSCDGLGTHEISEFIKGDYITKVVAPTAGAYPSNGKHTDGYWYQYVGTQTDSKAPTLSLTKSIDAYDPNYRGESVTVSASGSEIVGSGDLDYISGINSYIFNKKSRDLAKSLKVEAEEDKEKEEIQPKSKSSRATETGVWQTSNKFVIPNTAGAVTVTVRVKDNAGNISEPKTIDVLTIQNQAELKISCEGSPTYGTDFKVSAAGGTLGNEIKWEIASGNATITPDGVVSGHGTVVIKATMSGDSLYYDAVATKTIVIAPKKISIVGGVTVRDKIYDAGTRTAIDSTMKLAGVEGTDDVFIGEIFSEFDSKDAGDNRAVSFQPLTLSGTEAGRYELTQPDLTGITADILTKALTVSNTAVKDKIYDDSASAEFVLSPGLVGVIGSEDVELVPNTPSFRDNVKGRDKPIVWNEFALTGSEASNYRLTQPAGVTASITGKQVTVTDVEVKDKVYDGDDTAEFKGVPKLIGVLGSNDVMIANGTPTFSDKTAENGKTVSFSDFGISGGDADNYDLKQPSDVTADITRKEADVTELKIADKIYDTKVSGVFAEKPALIGIVDGDTVDLINGVISFENEVVGKDKGVSTTEFDIAGLDSDNYDLIQPVRIGLLASIEKRELTVSGTAVNSKIYDDGMVAEFTGVPALEGVLGSDDVTISNGVPSFGTRVAGVGIEVSFTDFSIEGSRAENYRLTQPNKVTANIEQRELNVVDIEVMSKIYDGGNSAVFKGVPKLVGILGTNEVLLANGTPTFSDETIGEDKPVYFTEFMISGADALNYKVIHPIASASITKREVTVSEPKIANKRYDSSDLGRYAEEPRAFGIVAGDEASLEAGEIRFNNEKVGQDKKVTVSEFKITGRDAYNYDLIQPNLEGYVGDITSAPIIITPITHSKVFGESDPELTYKYTDLAGADKLTGKLKREPGGNAGSYEFSTEDIKTRGDYELKLDGSKFTIKKAEGSVELAVKKSKDRPVNMMFSAEVSGSDGWVEFYILGEKVSVAAVKKGIATAVYRPASSGSYTVTAKLKGSKNYKDASDAEVFNVSSDEIVRDPVDGGSGSGGNGGNGDSGSGGNGGFRPGDDSDGNGGNGSGSNGGSDGSNGNGSDSNGSNGTGSNATSSRHHSDDSDNNLDGNGNQNGNGDKDGSTGKDDGSTGDKNTSSSGNGLTSGSGDITIDTEVDSSKGETGSNSEKPGTDSGNNAGNNGNNGDNSGNSGNNSGENGGGNGGNGNNTGGNNGNTGGNNGNGDSDGSNGDTNIPDSKIPGSDGLELGEDLTGSDKNGSEEDDTKLVILDITDGIDMEDFRDFFPEMSASQKIAGVYSIKVLKNGKEVEPDKDLKVKLEISDRLNQFTDYDVVYVDPDRKYVEVKSTSKDAIYFSANSPGQFIVVGKPVITDIDTEARGKVIAATCVIVGVVALAGLFWWFFLIFWKKKKKEEEEELEDELAWDAGVNGEEIGMPSSSPDNSSGPDNSNSDIFS